MRKIIAWLILLILLSAILILKQRFGISGSIPMAKMSWKQIIENIPYLLVLSSVFSAVLVYLLRNEWWLQPPSKDKKKLNTKKTNIDNTKEDPPHDPNNE